MKTYLKFGQVSWLESSAKKLLSNRFYGENLQLEVINLADGTLYRFGLICPPMCLQKKNSCFLESRADFPYRGGVHSGPNNGNKEMLHEAVLTPWTWGIWTDGRTITYDGVISNPFRNHAKLVCSAENFGFYLFLRCKMTCYENLIENK